MASELAVLMGAYNSEATIGKAVDSLRRSTYPCDIFIVDDGSRVPVADVLGNIPNVEVIRLPANSGIASASNAGLSRILRHGYKYVARLDADDVSHPDRFAKQVAFLESHPEIAAVGAWGRHFDEATGEPFFVNRVPAAPAAIKNAMFFNSAMINTSVTIRADVLRAVGPYSLAYPAAEDYELFRRISQRYPLANLPEVLIEITVSARGITLSRRRQQVYDRLRIQLAYFAPLAWRSWAGVGMTLLLWLVPWNVLNALKIVRERVVERRERVTI